MKSQKHLLSKLFISTLYLSAFTFGGGYVIITLMKKKFVDQYHWIDDEEMLDLIAIAQSSPALSQSTAQLLSAISWPEFQEFCSVSSPPFCRLLSLFPSFLYFTLLSRAMSGYGFFWKGCNPVLRLSSHQLFMIWAAESSVKKHRFLF